MCSNCSLRSGWTVPSCRFAHRLQSVAQAVEQPTHRGRAHAPPLLGQRRRQFRAALARPPQRRCRIPARQRIYEGFKGRQNTRLVLLDSRTSGARSPNAARRRFTSCDLAASMADRLPRQTGGRRHQRVAAIANRRRLGRCPPPATTLVQHRRYRAVLSDDGGFQLHVSPHAATMTGIPQDDNLIQRTLLRVVGMGALDRNLIGQDSSTCTARSLRGEAPRSRDPPPHRRVEQATKTVRFLRAGCRPSFGLREAPSERARSESTCAMGCYRATPGSRVAAA